MQTASILESVHRLPEVSAGKAPGAPGITPHWTSSAKDGAGTAVNKWSRVWFSISHGIVNEVYHPYVDTANTRDFGFLISDGRSFFCEEKRDTEHEIRPIAPGVPGYVLVNTCRQGRYRITKKIVTDPHRDVLLQQIRFEPLQGNLGDYRLYALLAPHVDDHGDGNRGVVGEYKGAPMLFASRGDVALALACSAPWRGCSVGYVGASDGWTDVHEHRRMEWQYAEAGPGNIALTGEIDLIACDGCFTLALGFGRGRDEAGMQARAAGLLSDFDAIAGEYVREWEAYQRTFRQYDAPRRGDFDLYRVSTAVLRVHEGKRFDGGMIASLSIPWGESHGDADRGYHLVWPRDQTEAAGAMIAAGNVDNARDPLFYLMCTQEADGHWPQNMLMDGRGYLKGIQTDETAFPILLADMLRRASALNGIDPWPMIRRAAAYLVRRGPCTPEDRWEENAGYSPFTLAVVIAAFLAAADMAEDRGEQELATYLRETADSWNAQIEAWTYVTGTELAQRCGVDGYYVRIAPSDVAQTGAQAMGTIRLKNNPQEGSVFPAAEIVSPDALALVRFGLRKPDDPRITNTVRVIDATLRTETTTGPVWHRYTNDGYGEKPDGSPFGGSGGRGRGWPLLAGERAHYELALGNVAEAQRLHTVMAAQTSPGGLLPEQVWDAEEIPARELFNGRPSGSGMPLIWAHAEFVKLTRSLADGTVFDTPPQTLERYRDGSRRSEFAIWRFSHQPRTIASGRRLRIETEAPAIVRWSGDGWQSAQDLPTRDTGVGLYVADLPAHELAAGSAVAFTFRWVDTERWEGRDFAVQIASAE